MVALIDQHCDAYGVESICATLPIAPATYFLHKAQQADPARRSARAQRDDELCDEIRRVWDANHQVYGPRKVWRQLRRETIPVARCRVRRLMQRMGLAGAVRGRAWTTTTDASATPDGRLSVARTASRIAWHCHLRLSVFSSPGARPSVIPRGSFRAVARRDRTLRMLKKRSSASSKPQAFSSAGTTCVARRPA